MSGEIQRLAPAISCHSWNADRTQVALCPNNNEIHIYKKAGTNWELQHVLKEHDNQTVVTSLDWAPKTNRLVSCSQDRNAYVWTLAQNTWKPVLVILRINRAATSVKWSPLEDKFAVASGAKCVSVCYFEQDNNWWVSKHIKKHKSTVLSVAWHPGNTMLVTGSSDYKCRVVAAAIRGVDKSPSLAPFTAKAAFGDVLAEIDCGGWVHAVAWSPSGNNLAFTGHDSSITFVDISGAEPYPQTIKLPVLPLTTVLFLDESRVVAAGHDYNPMIFTYAGQGWSFQRKLDESAKPAAAAAGGPGGAGGRAAFDMFKNKESVGSDANTTTLDTKHQNLITCINAFQGSAGNVSAFTTSGLDGNIIVWKP